MAVTFGCGKLAATCCAKNANTLFTFSRDGSLILISVEGVSGIHVIAISGPLSIDDLLLSQNIGKTEG